jgi:Protein of unknown function (DUF1091)
VNISTNSDYCSANSTINEINGFSTFSADVDLLKTLHTVLLVKLEFFLMRTRKPQLLISVPEFNYCALTTNKNALFVKDLWDGLQKFGNLVQSCPYKPNHYYFKDARVVDTNLPTHLLPFSNAKYKTEVTVKDGNLKMPVKVISLSTTFKFLPN